MKNNKNYMINYMKKNYSAINESDLKFNDKDFRKCLVCQKNFYSIAKSNRLCKPCKAQTSAGIYHGSEEML